ncbi:MAG: cobalamin-binding protein [Pedobacter sp.]|nr:MAG: cobalamin-binding protein [Pedobacter sp.]
MEFKDQLGNTVSLKGSPQRIISLVPSQTELLYDLGLSEEVIGITKFCIHPSEWYKTKTKVGGTKKLNLDLIRELQPDLIIGNKEENTQSDIETLQKEFPVWMSDIYTIKDAIATIGMIGEMVNRKPEGDYLQHLVTTGFNDLKILSSQSHLYGKSVLYLIWRNPFMAAGKHTFIDDVLQYNGFTNAVEEKRYPELNMEQISEINPELVFLSSEPYPFSEKHIAELSEILPNATIDLVDGEMFSWYGSRLVKAVQYFFELHSESKKDQI